MHKTLRCAKAALMASLALSTTALAADPVQTVADQDAWQHLVGRAPFVEGPWLDLTAPGKGDPFWLFRLTVDATGQVVDATWKAGPEAQRADAVRVLKALRFRPFQRDGLDVPARFDFTLYGRAADYAGPPDRAFPAHIDPATLRIALDRTECFGTCPVYRVEVRGNGEVTYHGGEYALIQGDHRWHVPPASLAPLIALLRRSDYFKLDGYYQADITDNPSFTTRVDTGAQRKFVFDYAGRMLKDEPPSADDRRVRAMPESVTAIEDAIDAVSGAHSWVHGDAHTVAALQAAHWDFHAPAAAHALLQLVHDCQVDVALGFLQAGAPIDAPSRRPFQSELMGATARCGRHDLVGVLESRGALARPENAGAFLVDAAGNGHPDFVALALQHGARPSQADRDGTPAIARAGQATREDDGSPHGNATFDPVRVIALLAAAGADPNARGNNGDRPLHSVASAANARALLAAGADARALNDHRQTALFTQYDADVVPLLVQAGADVDAADDSGATALETVGAEDVALALLAAGARPPALQARLDVLVKQASTRRWTKVLALLQPGASAPAR